MKKPTYDEMALAIKRWAEFDTELRIHNSKHLKQMMVLCKSALHRIAQDLGETDENGDTHEQR
jgi:hypothetical protein